MTILQKTLTTACAAPSSCDDKTTLQFAKQIQTDCSQELAASPPANRDQRLASMAFALYYFGTTDRNAWCLKNTAGGYAIIEFGIAAGAYLLQTTNGAVDKTTSLDIDGTFAYYSDNLQISTPVLQTTLCSNSYIKLANIYLNFTSANPTGSTKYLNGIYNNLRTNMINQCGSTSVPGVATNTTASASSPSSTTSPSDTPKSDAGHLGVGSNRLTNLLATGLLVGLGLFVI